MLIEKKCVCVRDLEVRRGEGVMGRESWRQTRVLKGELSGDWGFKVFQAR